eukprot:CFRG5543T1
MILTPAWTRVLSDCHLTTLTVARPFHCTHNCIILGTSDGRVVYFTPKLKSKVVSVPPSKSESSTTLSELITIETKGGSMKHVLVYNLFQFEENNVVTGDTHGMVSLLSEGRTFRQVQLGESTDVVMLCIDTDLENRFVSIVAAGSNGILTGLGPLCDVLWRLNLSHYIQYTDVMDRDIRCAMGINMYDIHGILTHFLVVADGTNNLHFLSNGQWFCSLPVRSPVATMQTGWFKSYDDTEIVDSHGELLQQQLIFTDDVGNAYILHRFTVYPYARGVHSVTNIARIPSDAISSDVDGVVMTGSFNSILVYLHGNLVQKIQTDDWIIGASVGLLCESVTNELVQSMANVEGDVQSTDYLATCQSDGKIEIFKLNTSI